MYFVNENKMVYLWQVEAHVKALKTLCKRKALHSKEAESLTSATDLKAIAPVLYAIITSGSSDRKSNRLPGAALPLKQIAPSMYIQAWLTMGKICLADGKLAKRYLPLFGQLMQTDCAALRNNIVVMMTDFCVLYCSGCYMSKITKCLRDTRELVRRQTFILLSRLLQSIYVK
ncbi:condensin-2 complex subunit D3 [Olea europaea subsp. europaea]|uniref:Condensin-2 complex subunit D3 n=1 Tax=Olea europaea subsp. europaea TaxID=158383 RepID=A0A8S0SWW7_OLEEU|nr:condensin-2 complex subunit D3 [Olea europaea subsp. europaea]